MKTIKKLLLAFLTCLCCIGICSVPVCAKVDVKPYLRGIGASFTEEDARNYQELAKKVKRMKKKKNAKYPDFYATGNHVTIGANYKARYGTKKDIYVYIRNTGNKAVTFYGVKIGESRKKVERRLKKNYFRTYDNGKHYYIGNAAVFMPVFKNGKLKSYQYVCQPTS